MSVFSQIAPNHETTFSDSFNIIFGFFHEILTEMADHEAKHPR